MRHSSVLLAGLLVVGGISPIQPAEADSDCVLTGDLIRVSASVWQCPGDNTALFPQSGGSEQFLPAMFVWNVTAGSATLPQQLVCRQSVTLAGRRITGDVDVDMSAAVGGAGPSVRPSASGQVAIDQAAANAALSVLGDGVMRFALDCGATGSATWSTAYRVLPNPPADRESGVSINDGADYTNDPQVKLFLGWRSWETSRVKVSNDGGFAPSRTRTFPITGTDPIDWRLVVLGNERLPKTVYVRFGMEGGGWEPVTYTDDIVLDTVQPQILSLSWATPTALSLSAAHRSLRVKAKDNRSGLKAMQIAKGKPRKQAKIIKYSRTTSVPASGRVFVRVRDGAGNWSKWQSAD
ncbi:MAG: hypothetical protein V9G10_17850 [Candidatus Nanopelagicales bacterium]